MSSNKFKPLGNRVLVKRNQSEAKKGGILLPDSAQEKPKQGEVLSVGPGKIDDSGQISPVEVNVGDQVLFGSFAGTEVSSGDEEFLIVSEDDILAVVE